MYRALWDRRHEGATEISQCTRRSGVLNRVHVQRLHVLPSSLLWGLQNARPASCKLKMKSWMETRVIMRRLLRDNGVEAIKDWVLSHISSIYSTPRCRCRAQTYTPEPRCHTSYTGELEYQWAVRLWIPGPAPTMCSKCHACMPVCKMYNPFTIHLTPQPCGTPPPGLGQQCC